MGSSSALIDSVMPEYDVHEVHDVVIHAPPEVVWSALHEVTLRAVPTFRALMTLRELPAIAAGRRWLTADVDRPILAQMTASGFVRLHDRPPTDSVLGLLTRPWRPAGVGGRFHDAQSFLAFDAPGWVKAILAFRLEPDDKGTRLVSETRVRATDTLARQRFRVYWLAIGWASGLTRKAWLDAVKRCAENDGRHGPAGAVEAG